MARKMLFKHKGRRRKAFKKVQPVVIVKQSRKRSGPKITKLLKNKTTAHLRYVDVITIDPGAAATASHVFRANSLFDPDATGTGHQPLMFDEYAELYGEYRVLSSKITITPMVDDSSNILPVFYGVFGDKDATLTYTLATAIIEDSRNKSSWGIFGGAAMVTNPNLKRMMTRRTSFNAKRNLSPDAAGKSHAIGVSPSTGPDTWNYQIWAGSVNGNNGGATQFLVEIDYIAEFTDPTVVTQS